MRMRGTRGGNQQMMVRRGSRLGQEQVGMVRRRGFLDQQVMLGSGGGGENQVML